MDIVDFYNAVSSGNLEKVKVFNEEHNGKMPLNKNITYAYGATYVLPLPLIIALEKGHYKLAKYLIENGADLDVVCKNKNKTPREFMPEDFEL